MSVHTGDPRLDPESRAALLAMAPDFAADTNTTCANEDQTGYGEESVLDHLGQAQGRAVAHSSFHHFADYNWDTRKGAPTSVTEPEGTGMMSNPRAAADIRAYVANLARWLAPNP